MPETFANDLSKFKGRIHRDDFRRVFMYVDASGDCWEWMGYKQFGYGKVRMGKRKVAAHRAVYELLVGDLDPALQLDHLCRNRACVNPDHLEQVDGRTNLLRGPTTLARQNARKTHCKRGHPFDESNTYLFAGGHRACKQCQLDRTKGYRAARRAR